MGGSVGSWAGLVCGVYAFICSPVFGGLSAITGGYFGEKITNEWFSDEIDKLLKEYNLD